MSTLEKIALGGGCHWCTEAVFQSLCGVENVEQGFVASIGDNDGFSEAVIVHFNARRISLKDLIEIHLYTHKSTSDHSMRPKYRSGIYTFSWEQSKKAETLLKRFQSQFDYKLITKVYPFQSFNPSKEQFANYYYTDPQRPFCENYIEPKLRLLLDKFSKHVNPAKLEITE